MCEMTISSEEVLKNTDDMASTAKEIENID